MKKFIFRRINGRLIPILNKGMTDFAAKTSLNSLERRAWKETKTSLLTTLRKDTPTIKLHTLVVQKPFRKHGIGSSIMQKLGKIADKHKKSIVLQTAAKGTFEGTTSKSRLVKFYKRFGFQMNKGRNKDYRFGENMIRKAK